jgi:spermidine/putrescine transport system substrate-binding protein
MTKIRRRSGNSTARAARDFNRRTLLKSVALGGAAIAVAPWYIKDARSSSGRVNVLAWAGYLPDVFMKDFEEKTGIAVHYQTFGSNEELIIKMKASKGRGYDIIAPSAHRQPEWVGLELTRPWDLSKIPNLSNVDSDLMRRCETWTWGGGQHLLPHIWGTEAIAYRTDLFQTEYGKLNFGDLWRPEVKGKVQGRPLSLMSGIGRHLAGAGKLPPFIETYQDDTRMREIWDDIAAFAIEHKPWIKSYWNDHDTQKSNFLQNGCVIGQNWDGPSIELMKQGHPIQYLAPVEGAFAWLDGLSMPIGVKNTDQAHAFVNAIYTKQAGAQMANATGYNATVSGVRELLDDKTKTAFESAYPGDALSKLWWWPDEPQWYVNQRAEYHDKFVAS